jgi:hypothetical protein
MANTTGQKFGGRKKNTPNRNSNEIRQQFQQLIDNNLEQLNEDFKALEPKDRINAVINLAKFCLPTLKATELSTTTEDGITPVVIQFEFGND